MSQPRRTPLLKSLRFQTLSYLLLLLLVVGVVSFVAGSRIMDQSLKAYEKDVAIERFARITQGVELSRQAVQSSATNDAQWGDSFNFMQEGNVSDLDRDNCMSVGMNAYLPKPVKPQHIHEAISHWAPLNETAKREAV